GSHESPRGSGRHARAPIAVCEHHPHLLAVVRGACLLDVNIVDGREPNPCDPQAVCVEVHVASVGTTEHHIECGAILDEVGAIARAVDELTVLVVPALPLDPVPTDQVSG